jgi:hypothetical protein
MRAVAQEVLQRKLIGAERALGNLKRDMSMVKRLIPYKPLICRQYHRRGGGELPDACQKFATGVSR